MQQTHTHTHTSARTLSSHAVSGAFISGAGLSGPSAVLAPVITGEERQQWPGLVV